MLEFLKKSCPFQDENCFRNHDWISSIELILRTLLDRKEEEFAKDIIEAMKSCNIGLEESESTQSTPLVYRVI